MISQRQRLGLLGGSFDPIHHGHLSIARHALQSAHLDKVYFIPAAQNPHKTVKPFVSDFHRLSMLRLAIEGQPDYAILTDELQAGGLSRTFDTLQQLRQRFDNTDFLLIIGEDQLARLHLWHNIEALSKLATFLVMRRKGTSQNENERAHALSDLNLHFIQSPFIDISATEIRERLAQDKTVDQLLPSKVYDYIKAHALYQNT